MDSSSYHPFKTNQARLLKSSQKNSSGLLVSPGGEERLSEALNDGVNINTWQEDNLVMSTEHV